VPPEISTLLFEWFSLSLDPLFVLTPLKKLSDVQTDMLYPASYVKLFKSCMPFVSIQGSLFFLLIFFFLKSQFEIPAERLFFVPFSIYIAYLIYSNVIYAIGFSLIMYCGLYLLSVPPAHKEAPGTYQSHITLTFLLLSLVVFLAVYVPQTSLPVTLSFIPLLLLAPISASISAYGHYLSPTMQYSFPTYLCLIVSTTILTFLSFVDQMPLRYDGTNVSTLILPLFTLSLSTYPTAFSLPGYLFRPVHFLAAHFAPLVIDPELSWFLQWIADHPNLLMLVLQLLHFLPPYQELYIWCSYHYYKTKKDETPLPPTTLKNYLLVFTKNFYRPLGRIFSIRTNVLVSFLLNGIESYRFSPVEDINALYLLLNFIRRPAYFLQYVIVYGILKIFCLPAKAQKQIKKNATSPTTPEASVASKLAQLRNFFSKNVTVHRYLDVCPDDAIHALYAIHITGSKNKPPAPIKVHVQKHIDFVSCFVPPPPSQPTDLANRLHDYNDRIAELPPAVRRTPPPPTSTQAVGFETALLNEATPPSSALVERLKGAILLSAGSSIFTGFFISKDTVCTVSHGQTSPSEITSTEATFVRAQHFSKDDVMLLQTKLPHHRTVATSRQLPSPDTPVLLVSAYPSKVVLHGVVKYSDSNTILSQIATYPGTSGSAIFTEAGHMVSMHQASNGTISASVPLKQIQRCLTSFLRSQAPSS